MSYILIAIFVVVLLVLLKNNSGHWIHLWRLLPWRCKRLQQEYALCLRRAQEDNSDLSICTDWRLAAEPGALYTGTIRVAHSSIPPFLSWQNMDLGVGADSSSDEALSLGQDMLQLLDQNQRQLVEKCGQQQQLQVAKGEMTLVHNVTNAVFLHKEVTAFESSLQTAVLIARGLMELEQSAQSWLRLRASKTQSASLRSQLLTLLLDYYKEGYQAKEAARLAAATNDTVAILATAELQSQETLDNLATTMEFQILPHSLWQLYKAQLRARMSPQAFWRLRLRGLKVASSEIALDCLRTMQQSSKAIPADDLITACYLHRDGTLVSLLCKVLIRTTKSQEALLNLLSTRLQELNRSHPLWHHMLFHLGHQPTLRSMPFLSSIAAQPGWPDHVKQLAEDILSDIRSTYRGQTRGSLSVSEGSTAKGTLAVTEGGGELGVIKSGKEL